MNKGIRACAQTWDKDFAMRSEVNTQWRTICRQKKKKRSKVGQLLDVNVPLATQGHLGTKTKKKENKIYEGEEDGDDVEGDDDDDDDEEEEDNEEKEEDGDDDDDDDEKWKS